MMGSWRRSVYKNEQARKSQVTLLERGGLLSTLESRTRVDSAEKLLLLGVLRRGILDACGAPAYVSQTTKRTGEHRDSAIKWIKDKRDGLFAFSHICAVFEIDEPRLRNRILNEPKEFAALVLDDSAPAVLRIVRAG